MKTFVTFLLLIWISIFVYALTALLLGFVFMVPYHDVVTNAFYIVVGGLISLAAGLFCADGFNDSSYMQ